MLSEEIKKDNIQAMKDHDAVARAIFGVVMNKILLNRIEVQSQGREQKDEDVIPLLQKTIKELADEKGNYARQGNATEVANVERQIEIVKKYLPKMMSEEEIKAEISKLEDKSIPSIMKYFKNNFDGKVDMAMVNKIARG